MENNPVEQLKKARTSLVEGEISRAYDLCVLAANSALEDPDILIEAGALFGDIGNAFFLKENPLSALIAFSNSLLLLPEDFEDEMHRSTSVDNNLEHPTLLLTIGRCYIELERWEDAISYLERSIDLLPAGLAEWERFETLGNLYLSLGRYDEGISILSRGIEYVKENSYVYCDHFQLQDAIERIIWAYQKLEAHEELLSFLMDTAEQLNDNVEIGDEYFSQYMDFAQTLSPEKYKEALLRVIEFHDKDRGEDTLTSEERPSDYCLDAITRLSDVYLDENKYAEALKFLDCVICWDENNLTANQNLARYYLVQGDLVQAENYLNRAITLSSKENIGNLEILAQLQLLKGDYPGSLETIERDIRIVKELLHENTQDEREIAKSSTNSEFSFSYYLSISIWRNELEKALASCYLRRVDALVKLDRIDDALDQLKNARDQFPKIETYFIYALLLLHYHKNGEGITKLLAKYQEKHGSGASTELHQVREMLSHEYGRKPEDESNNTDTG